MGKEADRALPPVADHATASSVVDESAAWLAAWADGDAAAGRAFYELHAARVVRFFELKVDDPADFVQRTFLRVLEAARDGRAVRHPRAYLLTTARRVLIDHLRRGRGREETDVDRLSIAASATSPTQRLARDQDRRALLEALTRLSVDDQIALELHYWEGLPTREIAEVLGVGRSAVLSRLHRARATLRAALPDATLPEPVEKT